jgi:hypothetical protein
LRWPSTWRTRASPSSSPSALRKAFGIPNKA